MADWAKKAHETFFTPFVGVGYAVTERDIRTSAFGAG